MIDVTETLMLRYATIPSPSSDEYSNNLPPSCIAYEVSPIYASGVGEPQDSFYCLSVETNVFFAMKFTLLL